jgi:hypothetical protein
MKKNIIPKTYKYKATFIFGTRVEKEDSFFATSICEAKGIAAKNFLKGLRKGNWKTNYKEISENIYEFTYVDVLDHRDKHNSLNWNCIAIFHREEV